MKTTMMKLAILLLVLVAFISVVLAETPPKGEPEGKAKKKTPIIEVISFLTPVKIDTAKTYWQASRDAWLRDSSSTEAKGICKIRKGSVLMEIGREGKWIKLEGIKGVDTTYWGYTYKNYLKPYPPLPPKEKKEKNKPE